MQWIYGNPLDYDDLSAKIDVTRYAQALFMPQLCPTSHLLPNLTIKGSVSAST